MEYIKIVNLQVNNNGQELFTAANLSITQHQKIGLIGLNGSGKTTMLRIINKQPSTMDIKENIVRLCDTYMVPQLLNHDRKSGGEKEKEAIASAIKKVNKSKQAVLLLDEPTANLDIVQQKWLVETLNSFSKPVLIVSHDQEFLREVVNTVWYIEDNSVNEFKGTYVEYQKKEEDDIRREETQYQLKKKKINNLRKVQRQLESKGHSATKKKKNSSWSDWKIKDSNKIEKKLLHSSKIMSKKIDREMSQLKKPVTRHPITLNNFKVSNLELKAKDSLLRIDAQTIYRENRALFKIDETLKIKNKEKIILTGENGCGKTFFLTELINDLLAEWINPKAKIGFFTQDVISEVNNSKKVGDEIKKSTVFDETTTRQLLGDLHLGNCLNMSVSSLSGGQLVCYKLAQILLDEHNMLILDEPDNFLDISSITALTSFLKNYPFSVIIVTHDKSIINELNFSKWQIAKGKLLLPNAASKDTDAELSLLRYRRDEMMADTSIPISQIQEMSKQIAELEKEQK